MTTYLKVHWKHQFEDEPELIYLELDENRWEKRKVEVFKDGTSVAAGPGVRSGKTRLSEQPIPGITEIATDSQFAPTLITVREFDEMWKRATT